MVATRLGRADCDLVAVSPQGVITSVEVKNCRQWDFTQWRKQARENAAKRKSPWLLLLRVPDHKGVFYVEGKDQPPTVWKARKEER